MAQVSVVNSSETLESRRFDAEYYRPDYLFYEKQLENRSYDSLGELAYITDGIHSSIEFSEQSNILLVSAKAPKENYFELNGLKHISVSQHKKNPRTALQVGDVIISTVGTIGNCAVVEEKMLPANSDRHVGIIRPRDISPFFYSAAFGDF